MNIKQVLSPASTFALVCLLAAELPGQQPLVDVGQHYLIPNQAGQAIPIFVGGTQEVQGLNFNLQIGDGGPETGGVELGPAIEAVDILAGTIFEDNNTGVRDLDGPEPDGFPQIEMHSTTTASGTVAAAGLLATATIDTTGFERGYWSLRMGKTLNGPTDFAGLPIEILDGLLVITLPGDANLDGTVDGSDADIYRANRDQETNRGWIDADFNQDGTVDKADFSILKSHWRQTVTLP